MDYNFITFSSEVTKLISDPQDIRKVTTAVCAQYVAEQLPMPTSIPDSIESFYTMSVKGNAMELLNPLNEKLAINVDLALEYIRTYWMIRYTVMNPGHPNRRRLAPDHGFFDNMIGVGIYANDDHICFVNQYRKEIFTLLALLYDICHGV